MGVATAASPDFANSPSTAGVVTNQELFNTYTEQNRVMLNDNAAPAGVFAQRHSWRLPNRGLLARMKLIFSGNYTTAAGSGAVTSLGTWPWNLIKNVRVRANGTDVIQCSGYGLYLRRLMAESNAPTTAQSGLTFNTAGAGVPFEFHLDVPLCVDMYTLGGIIYAESDSSFFECEVTYAAMSELATLSGTASFVINALTVKTRMTIFDVPHVNLNNKDTVVLPDLSKIFMIQETNPKQLNQGNGRVPVAMTRSNGQLLRFTSRVWNGSTGYLAPGLCNALEWNYGVNQTPRIYNPISDLIDENAKLYNGVLPNAVALDFTAENAPRDAVIPRTVTDLQYIFDLGVNTINAGGEIRTVEETLISSGR